ncbi:MAG: heme NO-binding domain-containing protein [Paracoccaceae bacterium]|nr:MAG: heme NO-binding domain-containing protein [Paracoccaceae bacterium]
MHGLVNRAIQGYLRDTFGPEVWVSVARSAQLGHDSFEPMLTYEPAETRALIDAAALLLDRPREALLEDLGTYLVSHPGLERLRRLLRFSGHGFTDFLQSLEDLPDRGRMAVPDLDLPELSLAEEGSDRYLLTCRFPLRGAGHVMLGLLRAMADDYGALVVLDHRGCGPEGERVAIHLLDSRFAEGRRFELAARA